MKKSLLFTAVASLLFSLSSCNSRPTEWTAEQRLEFLETINNYRDMVYLSDLSDSEFVIFSGDVSGALEDNFPVYTQFVAMPAVNDTVDLWVVTTIVDELDADTENMRHLYPYRHLVQDGVLPEGLDHSSRKAFYSCFAQKVNNHFSGVEPFFYAVLRNSVEPNIISTMQNECASDLFNWVVEVSIIEN